MRPSTIAGALRSEILALATRTPWRTAFVLEDLQLDLFVHEYRRLEPHFALFFSNSVAHLQHNFWLHSDALHRGYEHLDRLLDRLLGAVGLETTILLCSALGQELTGSEEPVTTLYRVQDLHDLVRRLDLPAPSRVVRTMADSFTLEFADERRRWRHARLIEARELPGRCSRRCRAGLRPRRRGAEAQIDLDELHPFRGHEFEPASRRPDAHRPRGCRRPSSRGTAVGPRPFPRPDAAPGTAIPLTEIATLIERFFETDRVRAARMP